MKLNKALHWPIYFSWTRISGGKRFHIPFSLFFSQVEDKNYLVLGVLFLECKIYFGELPKIPEITDEEVLKLAEARLKRLMAKNTGLDIKFLSKKLKISSNSVKQLATEKGYVVEHDMVFNEKL